MVTRKDLPIFLLWDFLNRLGRRLVPYCHGILILIGDPLVAILVDFDSPWLSRIPGIDKEGCSVLPLLHIPPQHWRAIALNKSLGLVAGASRDLYPAQAQ
jgi:hypothetical protein